ncbi:MAG TPA: FAD:protein FMN transferase [Pirellulaceae bacterium]|nr:FAD:protein FMN transferase [Pirellulaceae bacterium]
MQQPNRRRFLVLAAGGLGAAALGGAVWRRISAPLETTRRTTFALGTQVSVTARHADPAHANVAIDDALDELAYIEHRLLSIYQPESQISRLNRDGCLCDPSPLVVYVLRHAQALSRQTTGAFDITVQPLWEAFAAAAKRGESPDVSTVAAARRKVDWRQLEISDDRIRFRQPGMKLTLNGIAQGFATDRVLATLRGHGIEHALINVGEHAPLGESAAGDPWTVGIQHPRNEDAYVALTDLDGRCLATSGDYATTFSPDRASNHIFDPRTGYSPTELASVSVLAPSAMQADALSTALFVVGPDRGLELIRRTPNTDAFFVLKNGSAIATPGFPLVEEGSVS